MKNWKTGMVALFAASSLLACNTANNDSKDIADSINASKDTSFNDNNTLGVNKDDADFTTKAANLGMAEVAHSKTALEVSKNAKIRAFAEMMVKDHGMANEELMRIAGQKNITLPASIDNDELQKNNDLRLKTGLDFDKKYADLMIDGHEKTLSLLEDQAKDGMDADLRAFASKTSVTVKNHLNEIKKIKEGLK